MLTSVLVRIAEAWALAAALQLVLWLVQQRTQNAGIVDVGWALSFALVVAAVRLAAAEPACPCAWRPIAAIVARVEHAPRRLPRLARRRDRSPEEGRYVDLRRRWGARASRKFFVFFQAQAALTGVLSIGVRRAVPRRRHGTAAGCARSASRSRSIGIVGESIADAQLARWKRDARARRRSATSACGAGRATPTTSSSGASGSGLAVYGLAFAPLGLDRVARSGDHSRDRSSASRAFLRRRSRRYASKGEAYRAYQARVSRFIPLPPKRSRPSA